MFEKKAVSAVILHLPEAQSTSAIDDRTIMFFGLIEIYDTVRPLWLLTILSLLCLSLVHTIVSNVWLSIYIPVSCYPFLIRPLDYLSVIYLLIHPFNDLFYDLFRSLLPVPYPMTICGDLNLPLIDWSSFSVPINCELSSSFLQIICDHHISQHLIGWITFAAITVYFLIVNRLTRFLEAITLRFF